MKKSNLLETYKDYLTAPGNGVFTVHTARERKEKLQTQLFKCLPNEVEQKWWQALEKNLLESDRSSDVALLGVCSDTGGGILRGANWGPLFLRSQLLEDGLFNQYPQILELGDIRVVPHLLHDKYLNRETLRECQEALFKDSPKKNQRAVSPLSITYEVCQEFYKSYESGQKNGKIFAFGGDHSVSYPLVRSYLESAKRRGVKAGLIHFDAHTDLLDKRLGIDLCFATWTTHILKYLDSPDLVHQIGIRSSGKPKEHWEKTYGLNQHWADEVNQRPVHETAQLIIEDLKKHNVDEIYISFDIDALDSKFAPATGTPEPNGLSPEQASHLIGAFGREFTIAGADMVEVAPFIETEYAEKMGREMTVEIAGALSAQMIEKML